VSGKSPPSPLENTTLGIGERSTEGGTRFRRSPDYVVVGIPGKDKKILLLQRDTSSGVKTGSSGTGTLMH